MKYEKAKCKCGKYLIVVRHESQYYRYKVLSKGNLKLYDIYQIEKDEGYFKCYRCDTGYYVIKDKGKCLRGDEMKGEEE